MMYEELAGNQRRVRHIQGIHIKNLTPFPIRDHASSALQSTLAPILQLSDDTDLILARRRNRRVSQNSVVTLRTLRSEPHSEEGHEKPDSPRAARNRPTGPPVSYPRAGPSSPPAHMRRQRSISRVSLGSAQAGTHSRDLSLGSQPTSPPVGSSSFFYDASQRNLEKVMSSRLVETFVTLSTPEIGAPRASTLTRDKLPSSPVAERSPVRGSPTKRFPGPNKASTTKHASRLSVGSGLIDGTGEQGNPKSSHGATKRAISAHKSTGPTTNGATKTYLASSIKPIVFPGTPSPPPTRSASPARSVTEEHSSTIPFFLSPIHRPSTNPCWTDLDAGGDFAEWADRQQSRVIVTLWGKVDESSASAWSNLKGKAKSADPEETNDENWKILYEWDVHMDRLEKVEASVLDHFNVLPSNTLLLSLAPAGDLYFFPVNSSSHSPSPTAYASDSELASSSHKSKPPTRSEILQQSRRETRMKRSATWADLVKLSNLYAVVRDTQTSLDEVVRNTNNLIEQVGPNVLAREISEREENIKSLRQDILAAQKGRTTAVQDIQSRIDQLRARREALQTAFEIYDQDVQSTAEQSEQVNSARATYLVVHTALTPRRTTLCHTLDFIFPIEPDTERAADLVFTILDVPLPVPVAPSDPAPPLDNEEAVSAALGYAAHVVALLSSYMNVRVPYPVTYVGSRSYIRDPISAMHGPRMFPLYPTGVDTYRFEYAVFLLNKDIETLMAEQGLRAADLRHTLPNLKNLILTLTHGSELTPPIIRVARALPVPEAPEDTSTTPRAASPVPSENAPVPAASRSRFLSPFTALLRPIYTGTSARPKVVVEVAEPPECEGVTPTDAETPLTARPESSPNDSLGEGGNSSVSEQEAPKTESKDDGPPPIGHEKLSNAPPSGTPPVASPLSHTVS